MVDHPPIDSWFGLDSGRTCVKGVGMFKDLIKNLVLIPLKDLVVRKQAVISGWLVSVLVAVIARKGINLDADTVLLLTGLVSGGVAWLVRSFVWSADTHEKELAAAGS